MREAPTTDGSDRQACPECGQPLHGERRLCGRTGALLVLEAHRTHEITGPIAVSAEDETAGRRRARAVAGPALAVRSGGPSGATFAIHGDAVTIGRSPECDIFLDDVTVSRHHARISRGTRGLVLTDLGSLNGTYVNRRRIESDELLVDRDELQVGKFRLVYIAE